MNRLNIKKKIFSFPLSIFFSVFELKGRMNKKQAIIDGSKIRIKLLCDFNLFELRKGGLKDFSSISFLMFSTGAK